MFKAVRVKYQFSFKSPVTIERFIDIVKLFMYVLELCI